MESAAHDETQKAIFLSIVRFTRSGSGVLAAAFSGCWTSHPTVGLDTESVVSRPTRLRRAYKAQALATCL